MLDTNGNGKRDEDYVEPNQPVDPTKDKRIVAGIYGIGVDPERRLDLGLGAGDAGRRGRASFRATIRPRRRSRNITRCRYNEPRTLRQRLWPARHATSTATA